AVLGSNETFIYPRSRGDRPAEELIASFRLTRDGFESALGSVQGTLYIGRTSAGGEGRSIDCDGDGKPDAMFDRVCRFFLELRQGKIVAVEADRKSSGEITGKRIQLEAYVPARIEN